MTTATRTEIIGGQTLILGSCLEVLPMLAAGSVSLCLTDPPYDLQDSAVPIRGRGVSARKEESVTVGTPWGYDENWIAPCAALYPPHWIVFMHFSMIGAIDQRIRLGASLSALFTWRKPNAPSMARKVPRMDCETSAGGAAARQRAGEWASSNLW